MNAEVRIEIVREARKFLGVPFVHQGRSKSGLDCVGLVIVVARNLELCEYTEVAYNRRPDGRLISVLRENLKRVVKGELLPGQVVAMRLPKYPCHVGIVTESPGVECLDKSGRIVMGSQWRVIHALSGNGRVVEHTLDARWQGKIIESYEFPEGCPHPNPLQEGEEIAAIRGVE